MNFIPVSTSDYKRLEPFFRDQPHEHSAYCLSGLVAWNNCAFNNYYALSDKTALVYESPEADPSSAYLLMPVSGGRDIPPCELAQALKKSARAELRFVPQGYVEKHRTELEKLFAISEQPEYEDYVYLQKDLALLEGRKYAKKRNLLRQFEREYLAAGRVKMESISRANIQHCIALADQWYKSHSTLGGSPTAELMCDRKALLQTLNNFGDTGASGLLISVDAKPAGLGIASRLKADTAVLNFEKALDSVKGLYQYLDRECAAKLCKGCTYVNKESDLGEPGLRQAKESYFPSLRVKAFRLRPRTDAQPRK